MGIRITKTPRRKCKEWMDRFRRGVRRRRIRLNMMQRELAEKLDGFTTQNISQIECGQRPGITLDLACRIAEALGASLDALVGLNEERTDQHGSGSEDSQSDSAASP